MVNSFGKYEIEELRTYDIQRRRKRKTFVYGHMVRTQRGTRTFLRCHLKPGPGLGQSSNRLI